MHYHYLPRSGTTGSLAWWFAMAIWATVWALIIMAAGALLVVFVLSVFVGASW